MDSVMERNTCAMSSKGVTEINICLASRKRCHRKGHENIEMRGVMESDTGGASQKSRDGMRHGNCEAYSVIEIRYAKR